MAELTQNPTPTPTPMAQGPVDNHQLVGLLWLMMTSSNGNIFSVTGHLCGEFAGHRRIAPAQRPVTEMFDVSIDLRLNTRLSKQA